MKSGNLNFLEPSGPLQACNGTALPLPFYSCIFAYICVQNIHIGKETFTHHPDNLPMCNVNKNPTRCSSMQIFIYCKATLHVSGVTAPIIRSTKNCNRSLRYKSIILVQLLLMMGAVTPETCRVALQ